LRWRRARLTSALRDEQPRGRSGRERQLPLKDQFQSVDIVDLLADMPKPERADESQGRRILRTD
jgi:hypothetical protein